MARKQPTTVARAREIVRGVFDRLKVCRSVAEVEELYNHDSICKFRMPLEKYPRLGYSLTPEEVEQLKREGWIDKEDYSLNHERMNEVTNPIIKLLYAQAWKNGDLPKHRHIARGAAEAGQADRNCESAFVYYQFGAYLGSGGEEPIVDQHVLRAFGIYRAGEDEKKINKLLKLGQLRKSHVDLIDDYRAWMAGDEDLCASLRAEAGYRYAVDQVLFAAGRAVK